MKYLDLTGLSHFKDKIIALLNNKQDNLTAGNNISINNNVISATDTIYDDTEIWNTVGHQSTISGEGTDFSLEGTQKNAKIKCVGNTDTSTIIKGNMEQDGTTGKNMLDINTLVYGYVLNTGAFSSTHQLEEMRSNFIKVKPNTTYTFKIFESSWSGFNTNNWLGIGEYSSNNTSSFVQRDTMTTVTQNYYTFTTTNTTNYIVVSARGLASATKVQLEEGTATEYEAYYEKIKTVTGDNTIKFIGKNLFKPEYLNNRHHWQSSSSVSNNSLTITSTGTSGVSYCLTDNIPLEPNTEYTVTFDYDGDYNYCLMFSNTYTPYGSLSKTNELHFTTTSEINALRLGIYPKLQKTVTISNIQIEKGSVSTSYETYKSQTRTVSLGNIELCKIGNKQDYISRDLLENWWIIKEIGIKELISSNVDMTYFSTYEGYTRLMVTKSSIGMANGWESGVVLCTHFKERTSGQAIQPGMFETNSNSANVFFYLPTTITTLAEAKEYMDSLTNSKIYYVLSTEESILINEEDTEYATLYNQLNDLLSLYSYDEVTNINSTATEGNLQAILCITAYLDNMKSDIEQNQNKITDVNNDIVDINDKITDVNNDIVDINDKINNLNTIQEVTDTSVRIWDLDDGIYKLPRNCYIYYYGETDTTNAIITSSSANLIVLTYSSNYKVFFVFDGAKARRTFRNGYSSATDGELLSLALDKILDTTNYKNYIKNELTYSTSNNNYALSAYQGYVLNNKIEELNAYSTEEQRIGTWIDGKPLYRKTLVYNGAVTGANYIDLTSLNYEFIVIKETSFIRSNFIFSPVRYNMQLANDLAEVFIDNTQKKMNINIGSSWNNINCYVTIQYTKTTD